MTTEELKRAFDICLDTHGCTGCPLLALEQHNGCDCRHNLFVSAIDLATEQEREIEQLKADKKQAQIDVLNKVKEHLFFGVSLGFLRLYVDELIEEVQNGKSKS